MIVTGLDIRAYRGGEKYAVTLGRALVARGFDVRLLSKVDPNVHRRIAFEDLPTMVGLPVYLYRPILLPLMPPIVIDPRPLLRALRWADVVYAIEATPPIVALLWWLCRWLGRRLVLGLHSPSLVTELERAWGAGGRASVRARELRWVLRRADAVHALTEVQAAALSLIGVRGNVTVIPSFSPLPLGREPPPSRDRFEILFVGPLEQEQKGIDLLVAIARATLAGSASAHFTIVGSGPSAPLAQELVREFPERVEMLGFVPEAQLPDLYARSQVLALPSRAEAFPMVALEAFSQGVPVVGFSIPGLAQLSEIYPEGRAPAFVVEEFVRRLLALERLWNSRPEEYRALRAHCRAETMDRFGAARLMPMLAGLLGASTQPEGQGTDGASVP